MIKKGSTETGVYVLTITASVLIAFMLFLILAQIPVPYQFSFITIAFRDFFVSSIHIGQSKYPHMYLLIPLSIYLLALYGFIAIAKQYLLSAAGRLLSFLKQHKVFSKEYLLPATLVILIAGILLIKECQLRRLSYSPGSCYPGNDFSEVSPHIGWRLIADERGMNYFNPDSFKQNTDPTQLIVNRQGFPSRFNYDGHTIDSLSQTGTKRKWKQLFLGDSFLEGVGASTHDRSFIELYRNNNPDKLVCSTGIGGMDPVQYRLVSDKYLPELMPDEVVVLFCGWNDILWHDRKPKPYLPILTDIDKVGVTYNYVPVGITPFDTLTMMPDQAYHLYRKRFSLMEEKGAVAAICRKTSLTTQLYYSINPIQYYHTQFPADSMASYRNLKAIKDKADSLNIKFTIIFIPTPPMKDYGPFEYESHYKWAFKDLWPSVHLCPKGTITQDLCSTSIDYHLNDEGQKRFADYLQKALQKEEP